MNIYRYPFKVACPNNPDEVVEYYLTIEHDGMIMAERIVDACKFSEPMYQEEVAGELRDRLPGQQTIIAKHLAVQVTTVR